MLGKSLLLVLISLLVFVGSAQSATIDLPGVKVDFDALKPSQKNNPLVSTEVDLGPKLPVADAQVGGGQTGVQVGGSSDSGQQPNSGGSPGTDSPGASTPGSADLQGSASPGQPAGSSRASESTGSGPGAAVRDVDDLAVSNESRRSARRTPADRGAGRSGPARAIAFDEATQPAGARAGPETVVRAEDRRSLPERLIGQIPVQQRGLVVVLVVLMGLAGMVAARERRRSSRASRRAASDPLTGLANRAALDRVLDTEYKRASRHGRSLGVLLLDLDNFKQVNDRDGHAAGDRLLKDVAALLSERVRDTDTVARLGGDEFVVICPETSGTGLEVLADSLTRSLAEREIEVSIGTAELKAGDASPAAVIGRADQAMYERKQVRAGEPALLIS